MKFIEGEEIYTDDLYYDLFQGYIDPTKMLESIEEAKRIQEAINLLANFLQEAESKSVLILI